MDHSSTTIREANIPLSKITFYCTLKITSFHEKGETGRNLDNLKLPDTEQHDISTVV